MKGAVLLPSRVKWAASASVVVARIDTQHQSKISVLSTLLSCLLEFGMFGEDSCLLGQLSTLDVCHNSSTTLPVISWRFLCVVGHACVLLYRRLFFFFRVQTPEIKRTADLETHNAPSSCSASIHSSPPARDAFVPNGPQFNPQPGERTAI